MRRTIRLPGDLGSNSAYSCTPHKCHYGELAIIASPYSDPDPAVRESRYRLASHAVAILLQAGLSCFSPIVHSHPLERYGFPTDWSFWAPHDREHLARCDELVVLTVRGWEESVGVAAEVALAGELGIPVRYAFFSSLVPTSPTLARVAGEADG